MYINTTDKKTVINYPYGRLQCSATFSLEFKEGRGFRSVFQTVNPSTGRINNPKKGIYNDIMYISDVDGFIKFHSMHFYDIAKFNDVTDFLYKNFNIFTTEQIKYIYKLMYQFLKREAITLQQWCNVDIVKSIPHIKPYMLITLDGFKNPTQNLFNNIKVDHVKLESLKDKDFSPFKVTNAQN